MAVSCHGGLPRCHFLFPVKFPLFEVLARDYKLILLESGDTRSFLGSSQLFVRLAVSQCDGEMGIESPTGERCDVLIFGNLSNGRVRHTQVLEL